MFTSNFFHFKRLSLPIGLAVLLAAILLGGLTGAAQAAPPEAANQIGGLASDVCGDITANTIWDTAGSPYVLTCDVNVVANVMLTVEPGVAVKGNSGVELKVVGHLAAVGTAAQPITFTSATDTGWGQWSGLVFDGGTGDLEYVTVRYGGQENSVLTYCDDWDCYYPGSNITMRNVLTGEVRLMSSQVLSESNSVYADYGLYMENSHVTVSDTTFSGNGDYTLYVTGASSVLTATGNAFTNNSRNRITLAAGAMMGHDTTLVPQAMGEGYELEGDLTVPAGITLAVAPGVTLLGSSNVELKVVGHLAAVGTAAQPITFTSATDTGPRQWSGLVFDGGTGDLEYVTVRYGGQENSVLTYCDNWDCYYPGSNITVRNVLTGEVRLVSSQVLSESNSVYADYGLYVGNSHVTVSDTTFSGNGTNTADYALYVTGASAVTVNQSAIQGNAGVGLHNASTMQVDARSNWWGDASGPSGDGPGAGQSVSGNVLFYPWLGTANLNYTEMAYTRDAGDIAAWRSLEWADAPADPFTITVRVGNIPNPAPPPTFQDVHWSDWTTFTSLPADLSSLPPSRYLEWQMMATHAPTSPNAVAIVSDPFAYTQVGGPLFEDTTWRAANSPYWVTRNVLVGQGATLNIEPGVTVWMSDTRSMQVDGGFIALGTATQPITFTSWHVRKWPDDWGLIAFNDIADDASFNASGVYQSGPALQYVTIEYAGVEYEHQQMGRFTYALDAPKTTLYVDHCTIRDNGAGGVRSVGGYVTHNTILSNTLTATADVTGAGLSNSGGGTLAYNRVVDNVSTPATQGSFTCQGGGIFSSGGGAIISNTVTDNSVRNYATAGGGGIFSSDGGVVMSNTVANNLIEATSSRSYGGGIFSSGGGTVLGNTISDNSTHSFSEASGAGLHLGEGGTASSNTIARNRGNAMVFHGGGVYSSDSVVTNNTIVSNTAFAQNQAFGGGVHSNQSTVSHNTVVGNEVHSNNAIAYGGGLSSDNSTLSHNAITTNTAHGREAVYGGGVYHSGAYTLSNNTIISNVAYYADPASTQPSQGGGMYSTGGNLENNEIRSNRITGTISYAGGIYLSDGSARNNTVVSNTAQGDAGGIYWVSGADAGEMVYNTIAGNTTQGDTGGVYILSGYPKINHNAIYANSGLALYNHNLAGDNRLDARYNWWGMTNTVAIRNAIYQWYNDASLGFAEHVPYLFAPPNLSPAGVNASGRTIGFVNTAYEFNVSIYPVAAVKPVTFTWQASGLAAAVAHTVNALYDTAKFSWPTPGTHTITVTANNRYGTATVTYTVVIESASSSDAYESDDACAQAQSITADGATQLHTFHALGDSDWAVYTATAGTTYIIEATTPDDSEADVSLDVYDACDNNPQKSQNSFSPDVSLIFEAPANGPLYLHLKDERNAVGNGMAAYYLSVRALSQSPQPGLVVLAAGKLKENDLVQPNIYTVTNNVYNLFIANGYTDDRIYYLSPDTTLDATGDGAPDVDKVSTNANLKNAITQWAVANLQPEQPFTLYLMDHGGEDVFYLNRMADGRRETATPHELNAWLETLEAAKPGVKVNVIYEACYSGSFINEAPQTISKSGRVIITSAGSKNIASASATGAVFSDAFIAALDRGMSLHSSFAEAKWTIQQGYPWMTPWLDDNGNGVPNEFEDGQIAAQRGFAFAGTFANVDWPPYILQATLDQPGRSIKAQVKAQEGKAVAKVWALIYPPSYTPPPPGEELTQISVPSLNLTGPSGDGWYQAGYNFTEPGDYRVVIYALDDAPSPLSARPVEATKVVNRAPYTPSLPSPADGATSVPLTTTLRWSGGDPDGDAVTYTVAFGTANPPPLVGQTGNAVYTPTGLTAGMTYTWQITASDGVSASVGAVWSFTTTAVTPANRAPYTPSLPSPADGATGVPLRTTLSWIGGDPDGDAVTYTVAFGTANPPPLVGQTGNAVYTPTGLAAGITYTWQITVTDGVSASVGAVWSFTTTAVTPTNRAPYTPSLPSPADGATGVPLTATLSWSGGDPDGDVVTYTVAFGTANPPPLVGQTGNAVYTPTGLAAGMTYTWQITASDGVSVSYGPVWHFSTRTGPTRNYVYLPLVVKNY